MIRHALIAAFLLASFAPAQAETLLRLSETGRVSAAPDELTASLRFEAEANEAAASQSRVNAVMAKALAEAKATQGVIATTGSYQGWRVGQPAGRWRSAQTLELRGGDGPKILALVGSLQAQGLVVQGLSWRLAPETARARQAEATRLALGALRARAEDAARVVGLRFDSFREIRLDGGAPPRPLQFRAMAAAPAPMAEPVAATEDIQVEATVEADVILK